MAFRKTSNIDVLFRIDKLDETNFSPLIPVVLFLSCNKGKRLFSRLSEHLTMIQLQHSIMIILRYLEQLDVIKMGMISASTKMGKESDVFLIGYLGAFNRFFALVQNESEKVEYWKAFWVTFYKSNNLLWTCRTKVYQF